MERFPTVRRVLNRASEPFRPDAAEPADELSDDERAALLAHADADDEDMT